MKRQMLTEVKVVVEIPSMKQKDQLDVDELDDDHDHDEKINDNESVAH